METQERQSMASCVKAIVEANEISKSIFDQTKEIERFGKLRQILKNDPTHERHFRRNDISIATMENVVTELKERLKVLESGTITKILDKLAKATDYESRMGRSTVLSDKRKIEEGMKEMISKDVEDIKQRIDDISNRKLDKGDEIQILIDEADYTLSSVKESTRMELELRAQQDIAQIDKLLQSITQLSPSEIFENGLDESFYKLLGCETERRIRKKCDVEAVIKRSMMDDLGKKFVAHLLGVNFKHSQKPTLYPVNQKDYILQSLQVRDSGATPSKVKKAESTKLKKTSTKLAKMRSECDKMLLLFDSSLNSWSIQRLFDNLSYIDRITKNHKQVLETINNPWIKDMDECQTQKDQEIIEKDNVISLDEDEVTSSDGDEATSLDDEEPQPPPQINLYPVNNYLSAIMATSISEYTEKLYFSDLTQRLEILDRKLQ